MAISAADVKSLRDKTGAGMMDCKKALNDAEGDFAKAEKVLKEMGLAAAAKREGRATNEGSIFTYVSDSAAGILEVATETDFVARNDTFKNMGKDLVKSMVESNLSVESKEVTDVTAQAVSTIKENITAKRFVKMDIASNEVVFDYIHGEGSIGVLIKLTVGAPEKTADPAVKELGFSLALHAAAFKPLYRVEADVDKEYLAEQEGIYRKQAENMGKPEKVMQGIVAGKMKKHLSEICFVNQGFVKEDKKSVTQIIKEVGTQVGTDIELTDYVVFSVGQD